jgi:hypothetical protein
LREYCTHKKVGLWEGLTLYCEQLNMEPESAASLLTVDVLADLEIEVQDLNLLKERGRKTGRLPI